VTVALRDPSYTRAQALADLAEIDARQKPSADARRRITEQDHLDADEILLRLVGDEQVRAAWGRIGKWFA
jgi:hypothetical protein